MSELKSVITSLVNNDKEAATASLNAYLTTKLAAMTGMNLDTPEVKPQVEVDNEDE